MNRKPVDAVEANPPYQPGRELKAARRSYDLAMNMFQATNPSARLQWEFGARLQCIAHDNQILGWKRATQAVQVPHSGVVSPGSDIQSQMAEFQNAVHYLRELAPQLDAALGTEFVGAVGGLFDKVVTLTGLGNLPEALDVEPEIQGHPLQQTWAAIEKRCDRLNK